MTRISIALALLAACGGVAGPAGGDGGAGGAVAPGPCRLLLSGREVDGAAFVALDGTPEVALIAGFQGFIYALVRVRVLDAAPGSADVRIAGTVDPGGATTSQQSREALHRDGEAMASEDIMVFFNSVPYADLIGARVRLKVEVSSRTCACAAEAALVLRPGAEEP